MLRDTTDSAALPVSEQRLQALVEYMDDAVLVIATDGTNLYRSSRARRANARPDSEVIGHHIQDFVHLEDRAAFMNAFAKVCEQPDNHANGISRGSRPNGDWTPYSWSAHNATHIPGVSGIILNLHDLTEERRLEEQLMQARKMEAIGHLASGIAHDFNNILGAILGFSGFLLQDLAVGTSQHRFADRIAAAAQRARDLVDQILTYSRRTGVERKPVDLIGIVRETRDLLHASLPATTTLDMLIAADSLIADVNATEIAQVILNLCVNANDALGGDPGAVSVAIAAVECPTRQAAARELETPCFLGIPPNRVAHVPIGVLRPERRYARISVSDTGVGMDAGLLTRIFDPFFTTKERGKGTGLGLAVAQGIVLGYDGAWAVTSAPGIGSSFSCYLPLTTEPAREAAIAVPTPDLRGDERILVVDDEPDLTDVLTIALDRLGYEIVSVNDPISALEIFAEDPAAWDLVISDQVMPGMKGMVLFQRLRKLKPALPFILCTGFSDDATETQVLRAGADAFFTKPVSIEHLAATIRRLLDGRPSL